MVKYGQTITKILRGQFFTLPNRRTFVVADFTHAKKEHRFDLYLLSNWFWCVGICQLYGLSTIRSVNHAICQRIPFYRFTVLPFYRGSISRGNEM